MTCIVALETESAVWLGADSAGSNGFTTGSVESPKLFENGGILFGICGSFRMGQILRYGLNPPLATLGWDVDRWVATDLAMAVRTAFDRHGWNYTEHGVAEGGNFLIAVRGRAYEIQGDYSFLRSPFNEYAIGSGGYHAAASLTTTREYDIDTEDRILAALETAAEHVMSVDGPFHVITQDKP